MVRLFCLAAEEIDRVWNDIAPLLDPKADLLPEQVRESAKASRMQIFGVQDAEKVHGVCLTEILQTSRGLVCLIVSAKASRIPKGIMARLHDEIGRWAKELGCVAMRLHGRKGWLRWDRRYRQTGIVAERDL